MTGLPRLRRFVARTTLASAFAAASLALSPSALARDATPSAGGPIPAAAAAAARPEAATGFAPRDAVHGRGWMAVTANRHASDAAGAILAAGGSALDAAIAAQMVLGLVEPQSSGIGGGAFLLHYRARDRRLEAWDGRETAPAAADERLWLDARGQPRPFFEAVVGGRAVGVPGLVRMLERAHARHGRLPWGRLFEPAIALARDGFPVSPRLHALLARDPALRDDPEAAALYYDEAGKARPVGYLLRNPALADTLAQVARRGSLALHAGPIARAIVDKVRSHPSNPGLLGEHDLAFYRPAVREAVCFDHRAHRVCGMPPPSSGGVTVAQMLKLWRAAPAQLTTRGGDGLDPDGAHRFAEVGKLAFADRDRYLADPDFTAPGQGSSGDAMLVSALLDDRYLARRAAAIGELALPTPVAAGHPAALSGRPLAAAPSPELPSTTHLSIVDRQGNLVSMTSSIESAFGARIMVRGFLLNNQLTDFSFAPSRDGEPIANRVEPGKRPRSSMAPAIVFDRATGAPALVIGSPGGPQIIQYVARSLIAILDEGVDPQRAVSLPNLGNRNGVTELERGRVPASLAEALRRRGHRVEFVDMTSGLHAIALDCRPRLGQDRACRLTGAVDPRREGAVAAAGTGGR
ncbi:gamma-glutamyltransferase family protein [Zeimonas arvi]|uniref:Gamma-glutamyltransferase family protein n=1 Tax=Zeimonas arvi TaxID=2498847 RepID=A0A5C8NYD9_9BURK|nr:gamma-glutamyltransferase family protein [Zeimonas arvi]TXL66263.1 gamma-glutamyltransferase family protein [Zeimonas arvi]